jgi:uncharacterized protein
MSQQNVDAVRRVHEAFERGDIPGLLEMLADDVDWTVPETLPWGGHYSGRDEVGGFFASLPDYLEELVVTPDELLDAGDTVVDVGHFGGRAKSGGRLDGVPFVFIWRMKDGKVTGFREYGDTALYLRAVEGAVAA